MRLWTLHPRYLDPQGLLAVWREGLLAKRVLELWTATPPTAAGYRNHPQLDRFKATADPNAAINLYLTEILCEARRRNYQFNTRKICVPEKKFLLPVTEGQVEYERSHLLKKLLFRNPNMAQDLQTAVVPELHPLFFLVPGDVEPWEKHG
ncbi:MAG: pyrimidine dimer DNA glycosylase/endonuclease V [Planctomycetia bacterium]|nr:pyrimidine dimer DNA glycosylase/endonuclease V [Planctomycetia bacterium]